MPAAVDGITSSSADSSRRASPSIPLVVAAGDSIELPIRFQPSASAPRRPRSRSSATIRQPADRPRDRATPRRRGSLLSIADAGDFGDVCVGAFSDQPLTLSNSGAVPLTITAITSSSPEFDRRPACDTFPIVIAAGDSADVQIRFQPTSFGPKSATLTVTSDDPAEPATLAVSGFAPERQARHHGHGHFGPVDLGRRAERTITICNVGSATCT